MTNGSNQWEAASEDMIKHILQNGINLDADDLWQESMDQTNQAFNVPQLSAEEEAAAASSCYTYLFFSKEQRRSQNSLTSRIKSKTMNFLAFVGSLSIIAIVVYLIYNGMQ